MMLVNALGLKADFYGIINGSNGKIDPKALSTRAQAAVVLNRLLTDLEQ